MEEVVDTTTQGRRGVFLQELKTTSRIATPMVVVTVFRYLQQVAALVIVGHLGELVLSSAGIATSLANVTGFSLLSGMVGGLETLCGQAYGAGQYRQLGTFTYSAIVSLILLCPPICVIWIFLDKLLSLLGQDHSISHEARNYAICLIPALFGSAVLTPLTRFLQTQSVILPMLVSSLFVLCFHTFLSWVLVYKAGLGAKGSALSFGLSTWLDAALLGIYVKCSPVCERTRAPLSGAAFHAIGQFFRLGVPSAVMICLKWWSTELLTLLSGLLPNPKLQTSVLSICLTISTLPFTIPYGFGAAASTRVSNELGGGNPKLARMAVLVAICLVGMETFIVSIALFCSRHIIGRAFSDDKQVVNYLATIVPWICLSIITDGLQGVLSGVARGCGWQRIGACINLGAFYLVGLPLGVILGFPVHLEGKGLWIGIVVGSLVQSSLISVITGFLDWEKQAAKAQERISGRRAYWRSHIDCGNDQGPRCLNIIKRVPPTQ